MKHPNGCSTPAPKSSAAKQWIKELAQTKGELRGRRASITYGTHCSAVSSNAETSAQFQLCTAVFRKVGGTAALGTVRNSSGAVKLIWAIVGR